MEEWSTSELKSYLDEKAEQYEKPFFLDADPLGLLHGLSNPLDQETFGLLIATIAWGNRASIIKSGENLIQRLDNSPYEVIKTATEKEINSLAKGFVHRTFNADDLVFFCLSLAASPSCGRNFGKFCTASEVCARNTDDTVDSPRVVILARDERLSKSKV